jgi:hypothetical protein
VNVTNSSLTRRNSNASIAKQPSWTGTPLSIGPGGFLSRSLNGRYTPTEERQGSDTFDSDLNSSKRRPASSSTLLISEDIRPSTTKPPSVGHKTEVALLNSVARSQPGIEGLHPGATPAVGPVAVHTRARIHTLIPRPPELLCPCVNGTPPTLSQTQNSLPPFPRTHHTPRRQTPDQNRIRPLSPPSLSFARGSNPTQVHYWSSLPASFISPASNHTPLSPDLRSLRRSRAWQACVVGNSD